MPKYHGMYFTYGQPRKKKRKPEAFPPPARPGISPIRPPYPGVTRAPQVNKVVEQRMAGDTRKPFDFMPGVRGRAVPNFMPLGGGTPRFEPFEPGVMGKGGGVPAAIPEMEGGRHEAGVEAPGEGPGVDWNRLAYVLGGIGKAAMGQFQDRWQAQLGGQVQKLSQAQAYQKAMARALAGDRLDPSEFTILTPEQRAEINTLQTENEKLKMARVKARQDYELKLRGQELDERTREDMMKRFDEEMGFKREELGREEVEAEKERTFRREQLQETYRLRMEEVKERYGVPEGVTPEQERLYISIMDDIGNEAESWGWRIPEDIYRTY